MALATNLHRRGAVYYWRRRVPVTFALATGANWLKLSLRTREPVRARFLAAQLDATAADLFTTILPDAITKEQLATLFRKALLGHEAKLDRIAAFSRARNPTSIRRPRWPRNRQWAGAIESPPAGA
ncbi:hypothetical protein MMB17_19235 [Methylobacterium organophilum]|uniref:DUF6538 domain-containing protein n=1 Tax=Methylobacterium organophilum TaxID=410 RepID=UPI001F142E93|nr:DUF6538 domain-containing protein [Methylobacterium organophilum]UMY16781.1 hypothetical protein MMB17_19235 [Methylobacterium organophilum]